MPPIRLVEMPVHGNPALPGRTRWRHPKGQPSGQLDTGVHASAADRRVRRQRGRRGRRRRDGGGRRAVRRPQRRDRPGRLPQQLRSACLHHGQRLLSEGQPVGQRQPAAGRQPELGGRISATLDMVSAVCPQCWITLVETSNPGRSTSAPGSTPRSASAPTSWSPLTLRPNRSADPGYDSTYFNHPGVAIVAASGNSGAGVVEYPAASRSVTAVGGTTLTQDTAPGAGPRRPGTMHTARPTPAARPTIPNPCGRPTPAVRPGP